MRYWIYGVSLRSDFVFPFDESGRRGFASISLREWTRRTGNECLEIPQNVRLHHFSDGRTFLRWPSLFECMVDAAGREIKAHPLGNASLASFYTYLLGQAISFALLKQGIEQFHATVLTIEGRAFALTGDCGRGKSTLASALLRKGARLLVDDMLVLRPKNGDFIAYPGAPALKLRADSARATGFSARRTVRTSPLVEKGIFPVSDAEKEPVPLRHIYSLTAPNLRTKSTRIRRCAPSEGCIELVAAAFNLDESRRERMARQLRWAATISQGVPVSRLSYPRNLAEIHQVAEAVMDAFQRGEA